MRIKEIGVFSAKTHLSEILDKVSRGAKITITNRGKPVAQLIPYKSGASFKNRKEVIARFTKIRNSIKVKSNIKTLIEEGRKY